jgi:membrane protease subunit (stomatin/prohibitin family)
MMRRRRPLMRAAMVGGTAYVAGRAGAKSGAQSAQEEAAPAPVAAPVAAPAAAPAPSADDTYAQLEKLKKLLDDGVLTQPEFDAQKQKLLQAL